VGKKGKKAGGRGRSNPAPPTPGQRDEKESPRNGNMDTPTGGGDSTPLPAVTVNGTTTTTTTKRSKRGLLKDKDNLNNDSGESDRDLHHNGSSGNGNGNGNGNGTTTMQISESELPSNHHNTSDVHTGHNTMAGVGKKKDPSMNELKRRAAAMLDWIERAQVDLGRSSLVYLGGSPSSGSLSPPGGAAAVLAAIGGPVGPVGGGELGSVAEVLHSRLLGWQVEYGAG
jgi:hypothetical protein